MISATWEIDLWGRVRYGRAASAAQASSAQLDFGSPGSRLRRSWPELVPRHRGGVAGRSGTRNHSCQRRAGHPGRRATAHRGRRSGRCVHRVAANEVIRFARHHHPDRTWGFCAPCSQTGTEVAIGALAAKIQRLGVARADPRAIDREKFDFTRMSKWPLSEGYVLRRMTKVEPDIEQIQRDRRPA